MKKTIILTSLLLLSIAGFSQTTDYSQQVNGKQVSIICVESPTDFTWTVDGESFKKSKDTTNFPTIEFVNERTSFAVCMKLAEWSCLSDLFCGIQCFGWLNPFCIASAITLCKKNPDRFNHLFTLVSEKIKDRVIKKQITP